MSSNVLQPNPPYNLSLLLTHKIWFPEIPFCKPPKNPIFITVSQKNNIFHRVMWAFWGSLSRSEFHRENRRARTFLPLPLSPFSHSCFLSSVSCAHAFSSLSLLYIAYHFLPALVTPSLSALPPWLLVFGFWVVLLFADLMKKMKGIVPMEYAVYEDQRTRFRHQSLLQDYEELQKETEDMGRKLQVVKQKKSILSAEVRFLRQRYRYLMKNPSPKHQLKQEAPKPQKIKIQTPTIPKSRKYNKKELALRPPVAPHSNLKERTSNGIDVSLRKSAHVFDLNQNARSFTGKEITSHSSAALLDLNQKERTHIGMEAAKKSIIPSFDLNQISREEEELLGNSESFRMEEPKRSTQRSMIDEQHNDIKLSVCRNVGDGSNRTGKRKISWQDQVALRV